MRSILKSLFQIFLFNIFVYSTIENLLSNYFKLSEKYVNKYEKNLFSNTHHRKTASIKEIIKSTTPIDNSAKNSNLIKAYSLNGKLTNDYINLYAENVDKKDYINLINNHISLLNLIKSLNMSIFNNNSNVFSSYYTTKFYNQNNINLSLKVLDKLSSTTTKIYQNISQINSTKLFNLEPSIKTSKKYNNIEINNNTEPTQSLSDRSNISKVFTENFKINTKIEISSLPKSTRRNFFLNKSSYSTKFLVFNSKNSSNFSLGLNQNSSTAKILYLSYTTKIIKSTSFNNQNNETWYRKTNNTLKMNSTSLNSDITSSTRPGLLYITKSDLYKKEPTTNLQIINTKKKNLVLNSTNNIIKSLIIHNSTNLMTTLKMANSTIFEFLKVTLMESSKLGHIISEKSIKTINVTSKVNSSPKKFTKTFFSVNSSNLKLNEILDELIKQKTSQELTSIKIIATTQDNISNLAKESSRTTKTTLLSTFQLVSENLKKQNKLILTLDDLINSCPKSLENYCLNDGECYLKLYESSFLNFIEKLNRANVHSAIPNCKCKIQYSLNGLIMLSYSGLRCEIITHTFTYLSMGLLITLLIFILILAILAAMIYKIIFTCYNTITIKKKKENNNISFSANSSEYGCSSNDLTLKNNFQNYLNNKLKWFRKLEFPSVRNSWKYIKINKNSDQNKQISDKSINNFGNSDKNENLFLKSEYINPLNSKNITKPINSKKNNHSKRNFYQKSKQNYNYQISYHNKNNQMRKSTLNNQNNLQRYLTRRSRMLLKHFLYNSNENDLTAIHDENYLFSNRKIRSTYKVMLSSTLSSNYSSFSLNHLENMCKSNLYVYPRPSRISFNSNRFNSSNPDHESNNGALYY